MGDWIKGAAAKRRRRALFVLGVIIFVSIGPLAPLVAVRLSDAFYRFVDPPSQGLDQDDAAAFAKLSGAARRLAIYDAFIGQIESNYYDPSFSGVDWPKLTKEWRSKAAAEPNDQALYDDVFVQVAQRFPASHLGATPPSALDTVASPSPAGSAAIPICTDRDAGVKLGPLRRGHREAPIVDEVWPSSPAARAGVTPGWPVESAHWSLGAVPGRFKAVLLRLTRDRMRQLETTGSLPPSVGVMPAALTHQRVRVEFPYPCGGPAEPFETQRLSSGALYVRFDEFRSPVLDKVEAALKAADDHGAILDLRFNLGGDVELALSLLLPKATPVFFDRDAIGKTLVSADSESWRYQGPLIVLIGPASSSSAEILAAALKHAHRAVLVGRRTNGSVLGVGDFSLPDGGMVRVPVSDVEMSDGQRLEGVGVAPDIEIFPSSAELRAGVDPALVRAERELASRRPPPR